jgi:hypothetical protein
MDLQQWLRPDAPWLHILVASPSEAYDGARALERASGGRTVVRALQGRKMQTAGGVFDEMAAALQFPPYFGENWDALDECLSDLEWLPADAYVFVILGAVHLLQHEKPEVRRVFWETLEGAAHEWAQARPAKVFRIVLQCTAEEEPRLHKPPLAPPSGEKHRG